MYINEISKKIKMSKKAINLYEDKGLIKPKKDNKGYRIYDDCEERLLLIQQLRKLDFSIAEIKEILISHNYILFNQKKEAYQKQVYRINTSLQYLDRIKECIMKKQDIENISNEMDEIFDLENIDIEDNYSIDFEKIYFHMMAIAVLLSFWSYENIALQLLITTLFLCSILLYSSVQVRIFIYNFYKKFFK